MARKACSRSHQSQRSPEDSSSTQNGVSHARKSLNAKQLEPAASFRTLPCTKAKHGRRHLLRPRSSRVFEPPNNLLIVAAPIRCYAPILHTETGPVKVRSYRSLVISPSSASSTFAFSR